MTIQEHLNDLTFGRALIFGVAIAGFYYFMAFNDGGKIQRKISAAQVRVNAAEQGVKNIIKAIEDSKRFKATRDKMGDQLGVIVRYLPENLTAFQLMKILSEEARGAGVNINSITDRSGVPKSHDFFDEIPVEVRLEGTYVNLLTFLSNITKVDKVITISNMAISVLGGSSGKLDPGTSPTLALSGLISAYRFKSSEKKKAKK